MMRTRMLFVALTALLVTAGVAQAATIPVTGNTSKLEVTSDGTMGVTFNVEVGMLQTLDVNTKGGGFTRLMIPGFHSSRIEGEPELPMMNRLIAIPVGAMPRVEVSNVRTSLIDLADFGVTSQIMPAQPSLSKSADPANVPFVLQPDVYNQLEVKRDLVKLVDQGRLRSMGLNRLEISPVAYYPRTGQLEIVESMDVTITFGGADLAATTDLIARTYSPFFEHLYAGVAGIDGFHDAYPDRVGDVVTMVIVTPPAFASQLQSFAAWKTERGFHTILAVTGTPEVGTTTASIQTYLHGLYNNATPELPAPSFVLFVGDVAEMPTFTLGGDATDRPYCAVDGDLVPDMYYGRFSASNPAQLQAQLDKTMMYDQYTMPDPSYLEDVTLIAGVDSGWAPTHGNGQINYGTEHYFNASHGLFSNTYLYPASSGPVEGEIIQTVNDGVAYINYTAHGSTTSWSDPSMSQSDINGMTNAGKYTLAVGNCCLTSTYDIPECFGETWLRAANKGAIGYIGGSNSTYWDEDYWWGVGFHPAGEIDGAAWPIASTGVGAYDGLFHENGEPWYVTNDAIIFSGNLAVMEAGSSRIEYYWNIYNLLGDPSLSTYLAPVANTVGHPETVFVGVPSMTVTADAGSYVGLTQDGVLVGAGTVDLGGSLELTFLDLLTPGVPLKMVVKAQNRVPYVTDLNVIVPATVTIDPLVIDVNVPTDITVTVMDAAGTTPQPGIEVWAEGLNYLTTPVATNASGVAVINVTAAYGPTLDIVGQDPAETYRLFTEPVTVNALDLTAPDLTVTTDIGLFDAFALNLPGTLTATVAEPGHTLVAFMPDGTQYEAAAYDLVATPGQLGDVTGIIAVSGYNVYTETFGVIEAYGTVSGVVTTSGSPMAGVVVNCLDEFGGNVFTVVTDVAGNYASPEEILVDDYTLVVDHFGYLHYEQAIFVNYGANVFDLALEAAPSGVLSGVVLETDTYLPLEASVKVYRTDTGELFTETLCDAEGNFTTALLPYFDYEVRVRAWHHVPATIVLTINQPETIKNFILDPTNGDLLLIDDSGAAGAKPAKMGGKQEDVFLAEGYLPDSPKSPAEMVADLEYLGYFVSVVDAATVDPSTFYDYDLVILSCSDNTATLANTALKNALIAFAQDGGHILAEGGELGYDQYGGDFGTYVLHSNDWNHDQSGDVIVADSDAFILNNPNPACGDMVLTYNGYGDADAMVPLPGAAMPLAWSSYPTDAAMITYDANPAPEGGQLVFFAFNYGAVDQSRVALLENSVQWLLTPEMGTSSISGQVVLQGEIDYSGVTVSASPNGGTVVTGPDGTFTLPGLYAGTYQVMVQKSLWATQVADITLGDGQQLTDVDFVMSPVSEMEVFSQPGLVIGDNVTVSDDMNVAVAGTISEIEVFVDITHTYQGDLIVTLSSPLRADVVLHNRTGFGEDNLYGWYPTDLTPAGDLGVFTGEAMSGDWTLTVSDNAAGDQGVFTEWGMKFIYDAGSVSAVVGPFMAEAMDGGMGLRWQVDPVGLDGYNVYRRTADSDRVRLNSEVLPINSGYLSFMDTGEGVTNGATVFYSVALVRAGSETGFSQEIEVIFKSGVPLVLALHDNYPNPFNPITNIKFDLPKAGPVRLDVFDVSGRLVRTLVNEARVAAAYTVTWDGTDNRGGRAASGAYYYRLTTDNGVITNKMLLLK